MFDGEFIPHSVSENSKKHSISSVVPERGGSVLLSMLKLRLQALPPKYRHLLTLKETKVIEFFVPLDKLIKNAVQELIVEGTFL